MATDAKNDLKQVCIRLRQLVLKSTTLAGSGHPSTCLSAVELMAVLMLGGFFKADFKDPKTKTNDRLIFSKGHAAPLLYALYTVLGVIKEEEMLTLRQFGSRMEGHPTMRFPYTEAATGSLGQGLSVGVGLALAAKLDKQNYRTYVLLGDGELTEGSNWEAIALAKNYKLSNLTAILDLNRYEQAGLTMDQWQTEVVSEKFRAFGWIPILVKNGNNLEEVNNAFNYCQKLETEQPSVIIAQTKKGAGVSLIEDQPDWHGKALNEAQLSQALEELDRPKAEVVLQPDLELDKLLKKLGKLTND